MLPEAAERQKATFARRRSTFTPAGACLGATPSVPAFAGVSAGKAQTMGTDTELSPQVRVCHSGRPSISASG